MTVIQRRTDREIVQQRALRTREKIFSAALVLYAEKGYHNTTVDEIAKGAGVSTGIAYRYFKNKKELLTEALTFYFEKIEDLVGISAESLFANDISAILAAFAEIHVKYRTFHEELEGLRHGDEDVRRLYAGFHGKAMAELYEKLPEEIRRKPHAREKMDIAVGIMENYCHAYMEWAGMEQQYDSASATGAEKPANERIEFMREEVIRTVSRLMRED